tara:strand:- start:973 stop:1125 length:153 start_codon:yes stop_codon:yes gene_type:complete
MDTLVRRIDMSAAADLSTAITNLCNNMGSDGYRLASSFAYETNLILIFQK